MPFNLTSGGLLTLVAGAMTTGVVMYVKDPPLKSHEIAVVLALALASVFAVNWVVLKIARRA